MRSVFVFLAALFFSFALAVGTFAQERAGEASTNGNGGSKPSRVVVPPEKAKPIVITKTTAAPVIDGRPDEEMWKQAAVFKDFYQTAPGENIAPSRPTEVWVMYDEKNLYVAFKCWDEKDKVRATIAKRDNVFGEDNVRMWLDTYNDQRRAYVLAFNPFGVQQDGIYTEGRGPDFTVDIVMESKGVIEDWGWSVEVAIPFKSLRYAAGKGKMWGFNAARNIDRFNDEFDQWLPDDRNVSGFLIKHGKITGLDDIKYEKTLEVTPSLTVSETGRRVQIFPTGGPVSDRFINDNVNADFGVTVKYTLSPNVTFDAAYNPDFAEIEADAPVVTANQRFPIFFEEKRPFFLEGADIFNSPLQVFYSRQIFDPDIAAKLTGKVGKTSFGALIASDNRPGDYSIDERANPALRPRISEFVDKNASFAVLRLKRDFGSENNIGFFATYRGFPEQKNLLAGFDGRIKWDPRTVSTFQVVGTNSKRCFFDAYFEPLVDPLQAQRNREICGTGTYGTPSNPQAPGLNNVPSTLNRYQTGNGIGYYANLDYTADQHGWVAEVGGRTKYYRADSGFTRRVDSHFGFFFNRFSTKSNPKGKIIRANWGQFTDINYDGSGRIQSHNLGTNLNLSLQRNTFLFFEAGNAFEKIYEEEFGPARMPTRPVGTFLGEPTRSTWRQYLNFNIDQTPNKYLTYGAFIGHTWNATDYFYFEFAPPPVARFQQNPGPGNQLNVEVYGELKPTDPLRITFNYNKSRLVRDDNRVRSFDADILSIRTTYQFTRFVFARFRLDYDSLSQNYAGQALFGWNPSPGKAFYIGYNDNLNRDGFNPYTGNFEPGFARNSRTFFIRASYLFRKSF